MTIQQVVSSKRPLKPTPISSISRMSLVRTTTLSLPYHLMALLLVLLIASPLPVSSQFQIGGGAGGGGPPTSPKVPVAAQAAAEPAAAQVEPAAAPSSALVEGDTTAQPEATEATEEPTVDVRDLVFFTMEYGFQEIDDREPSQEEIEEVLCITTQFIQWTTETWAFDTNHASSGRPIQVFATNVDYSYQAGGQPLSIQINFTADATYMVQTPNAHYVERVPKEIIFRAFDFGPSLVNEKISQYITEWVWETSYTSVFYNTIRVNYNVRRILETNEINSNPLIPELDCAPDITKMPTTPPVMPTTSPTTSTPTTATPTVSPGLPTASPTTPSPTTVATLSPDATQKLMYFQMDLQLLPEEEEDITTTTKATTIESLMCLTASFIQDQVQLTTQDPSIQSTSSNIDWTITDANSTRLTIYFTCRTTTFGDQTVLFDTVTQAVTNKSDDLLQYWKEQSEQQQEQRYLQVNIPAAGSGSGGIPAAGGLGNSGSGGGSSAASGIFNQGNSNSNIPQNESEEEDNLSTLLDRITQVQLQALPKGTPVRVGKLEEPQCPTTAPTIVPAPSASASTPSSTPTPTVVSDDDGDTEDSQDSNNNETRIPTSGDFQGGNEESDDPNTTAGADNDEADGSGNGSGRDSPIGTADPTSPATAPADDTITVTVEFLVSNLDKLEEPDDIIFAGGLYKAWPILVKDLVQSLKLLPPTNRRLRGRERQLRHERQLVTLPTLSYEESTSSSWASEQPHRNVDYKPNSAMVTSVYKTSCGPYVHVDSICQEVKAKYDLYWLAANDDVKDADRRDRDLEQLGKTEGTTDDREPKTTTTSPAASRSGYTQYDQAEVKRVYQVETYKAINDGTFYSVLKRQVPDTPLYIGTIPLNANVGNDGGDGDQKSGLRNTDYLIYAGIGLLGLLCLLMVLAICARLWGMVCSGKKDKEDDNVTRVSRRSGRQSVTTINNFPRTESIEDVHRKQQQDDQQRRRRTTIRQSQFVVGGPLVEDDDDFSDIEGSQSAVGSRRSYYSHSQHHRHHHDHNHQSSSTTERSCDDDYDDDDDDDDEFEREMRRQEEEIEREVRAQREFQEQQEQQQQQQGRRRSTRIEEIS